MEVIATDNGLFYRSQFESGAALEKAIVKIQAELFGKNRMYLDVKKKIGAKGGLKNIPVWRRGLRVGLLYMCGWQKILSV